MKLADFKQQTDESIADYLERAANLVTKFPTEEFDIGMATVRGINNQEHQDWIERECHRTEDFTFTSVGKLVKVSYTKIGQPDAFDSSLTPVEDMDELEDIPVPAEIQHVVPSVLQRSKQISQRPSSYSASGLSAYVRELHGSGKTKRYHLNDLLLYKPRSAFKLNDTTIMQKSHGTVPAIICGRGGEPGSRAVFLSSR